MTLIHTTDIISDFKYSELVKQDYLPLVSPFKQQDHITHQLPSFVKTGGHYTFFGMFMEHAFRLIDAYNRGICEFDLKQEIINVFDRLKVHYGNACYCSLSDKDYEIVFNILYSFWLTSLNLTRHSEYIYDQQLLTHFGLLGLPDLVTFDPESNNLAVYEMKVSTYFPRMKDKAWMQVLTYCCIYQQMGYNVTDAYILLPLNSTYLHCDVSKFDFSEYFNLLHVTVSKRSTHILTSIFTPVLSQRVYGGHITKERTVYKSLLPFIDEISSSNVDTCAFQMFIRNPKSGAGSITKRDKSLTSDLIKQRGVKIFCHGVYIVNLSNPETKFHIAVDEIKDSVDLGFSGFVVHCGKNVKTLKQTHEVALDLMEERLRALMNLATDQCPVILETSSGQGTELCYDVVEFITFFRRFNRDQRIKICVDTCHVFAAGYDPLEFINEVLRCEPESVVLVHLNGSENERGSRKDRHCKLNEGYIPFESIQGVIDLCVERGIAMVRE